MKKAFYFIFTFIFVSQIGWSQLHIEPMHPPEMMSDFFNTDCASVSNLSYDGSSIAFFEGANTDLGLLAGIFLSTGDVFSAIGENTSEGTSGATNGGPDPDLEAIATSEILETSIIEMDLVSDLDFLSFAYVFASEEYCEYVNSTFNDVFGFFISGPGLNGPYSNGAVNVAMLPDGLPVAINSVNHLLNQEYFVGGSGSCGTGPIPFITFDGMTTVMGAEIPLVPGETYHVKIAVGDAGDGIFDSGVLIGIQSLCGDSLLIPPAQFVVNQDIDGNFEIENESKYATSYLWDFGDGTTSLEKNPGAHTYDFSVQNEYELSLITQNYCCSDTFSMMINEELSAPIAQFSSNADEICPGQTIEYMDMSTGEVDSWNWSFNGGNPSSSTEQNPIVQYNEPGLYDVSLEVSNSAGTHEVEESSFVEIHPEPIADFSFAIFSLGNVQFTNLSQFAISANWNFGDGDMSTELNPSHAYTTSGTYTVTLTVVNDCGSHDISYTVDVLVDSVKETPEQQAIQFHPNPAKEYLQLIGLEKSVGLVVYNHLGQLVHKQTATQGETIEVKDWARGLYLINIHLNDSKEPLVRKIILD